MYWKKAVAGVLTAMVCVGFGTSVALAEPSASGSAKPGSPGPLLVLAYIAGRSGTALQTLVAEFKGGKSLQAVAEENGIEWAEAEKLLGRKPLDKEKIVSRLEQREARLTEERAKLEEHVAGLSERISGLEQRIPQIKDETMRGFAEEFLGILEQRVSLAQEKLSLLEETIKLTHDLLEYLKTL